MIVSAGTRARRRRLFYRWLLLPALALAVLGAAFWFGREVGGFEQAARVRRLEQQLVQMEELGRQANVARAQAEQQLADAANKVKAELATISARVPQGDLATLQDLMRARLEEGVPVERLRFLVEQARKERRCNPGTEKRRFSPRLPTEVSPLQTVSFLDNKITISGTGVAAADKNGVLQSWFDPLQPVEIRVLRIGGGIEMIKGTLPTGHSIVADGREYRFGFASSDRRGVIEVSMEDCAYP